MEHRLAVLIIEDDRYISGFTEVSLRKEGYEVFLAESASEGFFLFASRNPELILLDLGLPDQDGLDFLREIRKKSEVPVIVVSARGQEHEKIAALDAGADDYLTKPFYMGELLARIRVIERKNRRTGTSAEREFTLDGLSIDFERRRVVVDGTEVHLTPYEYKLLQLLVENRGKVLTHHFILGQIWGYQEGDTKTVRVFMANLRRKIERDSANPRYILTEVGVGYRFVDE